MDWNLVIQVVMQAILAGLVGGTIGALLSWAHVKIKKKKVKNIILCYGYLEQDLYDLFKEQNPLDMSSLNLNKDFGKNWIDCPAIHKKYFMWQSDVLKAIIRTSEKSEKTKDTF